MNLKTFAYWAILWLGLGMRLAIPDNAYQAVSFAALFSIQLVSAGFILLIAPYIADIYDGDEEIGKARRKR